MVTLDNRELAGPTGGFMNMPTLVDQIAEGGADAVLGYYHTLSSHKRTLKEGGVKRILSLTTNGRSERNTRKTLLGPDPHTVVANAVSLGVDGVAVHVSTESEYTGEMIQIFSGVRMARDMLHPDLPLVVAVTPRGEYPDGSDRNYVHKDEFVEMARRAMAIGSGHEADVVKIGWVDKSMIQSADGVPVILAGGTYQQDTTRENLQTVYDAIEVVARGVAFGRKVVEHEDPQGMVVALTEIVHKGKSPQEAMSQAGIR